MSIVFIVLRLATYAHTYRLLFVKDHSLLPKPPWRFALRFQHQRSEIMNYFFNPVKHFFKFIF